MTQARKTNNQHSPREAAYDIAIGALEDAFLGHASLANYAGVDQLSRIRRIRKAVATLHNFLLERSGMEGTVLSLDEEEG